MPKKLSKPARALFPAEDDRKVIDFKDLCELTRISDSTLRNWLSQGAIGGAFQYRKHGRWLFGREALEKWWEGVKTSQQPTMNTEYLNNCELPKQKALANSHLKKVWSKHSIAYWTGYLDAISNIEAKLNQPIS